MIRDYNIHMGGVDRVDQQLHRFHTLRKSYKWYKKLAFRILMQVKLNAHKVFQKTTESAVNLHSFIHEIIATLITLRSQSKNVNLYLMIHFTVYLVDILYSSSRKARPKQKTNVLKKGVDYVIPVEYVLRMVLL